VGWLGAYGPAALVPLALGRSAGAAQPSAQPPPFPLLALGRLAAHSARPSRLCAWGDAHARLVRAGGFGRCLCAWDSPGSRGKIAPCSSPPTSRCPFFSHLAQLALLASRPCKIAVASIVEVSSSSSSPLPFPFSPSLLLRRARRAPTPVRGLDLPLRARRGSVGARPWRDGARPARSPGSVRRPLPLALRPSRRARRGAAPARPPAPPARPAPVAACARPRRGGAACPGPARGARLAYPLPRLGQHPSRRGVPVAARRSLPAQLVRGVPAARVCGAFATPSVARSRPLLDVECILRLSSPAARSRQPARLARGDLCSTRGSPSATCSQQRLTRARGWSIPGSPALACTGHDQPVRAIIPCVVAGSFVHVIIHMFWLSLCVVSHGDSLHHLSLLTLIGLG
jgi:hypothetical protein